jgi:hypothetical protein
MEKIEKATSYLEAWIASNGRFDLEDAADRAGVLDELDFVRKDLLEEIATYGWKAGVHQAFLAERRRNSAPRPLL